MDLPKAHLVPIAKGKDYGIHRDKREGVSINTYVPLHVGSGVVIGPGDEHFITLPITVHSDYG